MSISAITGTYDYYQPSLKTSRVSGTTAEETRENVCTKSGSLLENCIDQLFGFPLDKSGSISIDELLEHGTRQLEEFNRDMRRLFRENGIDTSFPVELGSQYGTGETIVTNDHPDKEKIAQLFRENPEMSNDFKRITGMLELAEAGKEAVAFQNAYRQNPQQAVAQYAHLFTTKLTSTVRLEDDQVEILFQRIPKNSVSNASGYEEQVPGGLAIEMEV